MKKLIYIILIFFSQFLIAQNTTWNGSNNNLWSNPLNWSNGVPQSSSDVTIPWLPASAHQPVIDINTTFNRLTMNSNPNTITLADSVRVILRDRLTIGNSATLNIANGNMIVYRRSSTGGNIKIDNGSLTFLEDFTYNGSGIMTVQTGTLTVGSTEGEAVFYLGGSNRVYFNDGTLNLYGKSTFAGSAIMYMNEAYFNSYGEATITGSSILYAIASRFKIYNNFIITGSGQLHAGNSEIIMSGEKWWLANSGSFFPETSKVIFTSDKQYIDGTGGVTRVDFYNVEVIDESDVEARVSILIIKDLVVNENASFLIIPNRTLNVVEKVQGYQYVYTNRPYIIYITVNDMKTITATFNEALQTHTVQNLSNYRLVNIAGETIGNVVDVFHHIGSNNNRITLTLDIDIIDEEVYFLIANNILNMQNLSLSAEHLKIFGNDEILLPVELLSFTGKQFEKSILLEWTTATELNNDYFTIEKSLNGKSWDVIGVISGSGNSNRKLSYSMYDDVPIHGIQYYRLKQTDYDGAYEYFNPISVEYNEVEKIHVKVYPNPAIDFITIDVSEYSKALHMNISIVDMNGKVLFQRESLDTVYTIDVSGFPNGLYFLYIANREQVSIQKIIKK